MRITLARGRGWLIGLTVGVLVSAFLVVQPRQDALAAEAANFDPGYLISDENFYSGSAMSESEIQAFLERQVGSCANDYCLARYRESTPTRTWSFGTCSTYVGGASEPASRIIFKVQQACGLSAKVILTTLQKEQSLITAAAPSAGVLQKAMGYGCPDTSACDSTYYGFFNQVFAAGRQLTWYTNPAGSFTSIRIGEYNSIRYSPDPGCGSKNVLVKNRATAALYYYTPYTPNNAAMSNLYGLGDGCSAYGNRNFWRMYTDWFGSPTGDRNPFGNIELREGGIGGIRVGGWALDPDSRDSIDVHVYVDGVGTRLVANQVRPDVGAAYGLGDNHGFLSPRIPVSGFGMHTVCVYAINTGAGSNSLMSCFSLEAYGGSPTGVLDSVQPVDGGVTVAGWAIDPDTQASTQVHIYVDDRGAAYTANKDRPDVGRAYPAFGSAHGFNERIAVGPGTHRICAYAINTSGPGTHQPIGCREVNVLGELGRAPIGVIDQVAAEGDAIHVRGWAIDPDTASPLSVHIYIDGVGTAFTADDDRPDLATAFPGYGPNHGFDERIAVAPGMHKVCVYGINSGPGTHTLIGCSTIAVGPVDAGRAPFGVIDGIKSVAGGIEIAGWTIDPDTAERSTDIHVYVDTAGAAYSASKPRPDIAAAFPGSGEAHGFVETVAAAPGSRRVCIYAINTGAGSHTLMGCGTVVVP